jgi:salicylate hydroxylase/6-hydroxynicotinate 3-monooxygenase
MAQGGAMALEDAVVLARCLADLDVEPALSLYERHRKPRTSRIQATSSANTWGRTAEPETDWLYAYNAWTVPLETSVPAV